VEFEPLHSAGNVPARNPSHHIPRGMWDAGASGYGGADSRREAFVQIVRPQAFAQKNISAWYQYTASEIAAPTAIPSHGSSETTSFVRPDAIATKGSSDVSA
jgi:hypothetical protein